MVRSTSCIPVCLALLAGFALAPLPALAGGLPGSGNGFARVAVPSDDGSAYAPVDALCVEREGVAYITVTLGAGDTATLARRGHGMDAAPVTYRLGQPDAGAGQIRYALMAPDGGQELGNLHFVNPGMLADPATIGMPTLSSITVGENRTECRMAPDIAYLGIDSGQIAMVTAAQDGALTLAIGTTDSDEPLRRLTGGKWASGKADDIYFLFFDEERLAMIKAAPRDTLAYPAWSLTGSMDFGFWGSPAAYFSGDMAKLGLESSRVPYGLALHLERMDTCQHLSGEWSGEADRDAQVAASWQEGDCDATLAEHGNYIADYADDPAILAVLSARSMD